MIKEIKMSAETITSHAPIEEPKTSYRQKVKYRFERAGRAAKGTIGYGVGTVDGVKDDISDYRARRKDIKLTRDNPYVGAFSQMGRNEDGSYNDSLLYLNFKKDNEILMEVWTGEYKRAAREGRVDLTKIPQVGRPPCGMEEHGSGEQPRYIAGPQTEPLMARDVQSPVQLERGLFAPQDMSWLEGVMGKVVEGYTKIADIQKEQSKNADDEQTKRFLALLKTYGIEKKEERIINSLSKKVYGEISKKYDSKFKGYDAYFKKIGVDQKKYGAKIDRILDKVSKYKSATGVQYKQKQEAKKSPAARKEVATRRHTAKKTPAKTMQIDRKDKPMLLEVKPRAEIQKLPELLERSGSKLELTKADLHNIAVYVEMNKITQNNIINVFQEMFPDLKNLEEFSRILGPVYEQYRKELEKHKKVEGKPGYNPDYIM